MTAAMSNGKRRSQVMRTSTPEKTFTVIPTNMGSIARLVSAICLMDEEGARVFVDETLSAEKHSESVAHFKKHLDESSSHESER